MSEDTSTDIDYRYYLGLIRKRRHVALAVGLLVLSICTWGSLIFPKTYEASATVFIQRGAALDPLIKSVGAAGMDDMLRNVTENMTSRSVLERAVAKLSQTTSGSADGKQVPIQYGELKRNIKVTLRGVERGPEYFVVSYQSSDPVLTRNITNAIVEAYIAENASYRRTDAEGAFAFIKNQIAEYKEKLDKVDKDIKAQKALSGRGPGADAQLRVQNAADLRARIKSLNNQLTVLNTKYTSEHPEIQRTMNEIEDIKRQLAEESQKSPSASSYVRELPAQGSGGAPGSLVKLQRERDVYQRLHDDLLMRLENVRVSQDLESDEKKNALKIVEPASLPGYPVKPDRFKLILVGFFLSIASAIGVAIGLEFLDNSIKNEETIEKTLGISVLAVVPKITIAEDIIAVERKDRMLLIATSAYVSIIILVFVREVFSKFFGMAIFGF